MDITQAAFGLDMKSASRIYFINPVLNPQVEAQAIGRARRISQKKPVSVETLVLRGSVEEVIVRRRGEMTQAEQWKCKSILDDRPIYEWILNVRILPLEEHNDGGGEAEMARLETPLYVFGRGFGRELSHADQDLVGVNGSPVGKKRDGDSGGLGMVVTDRGRKRRSPGTGAPSRSAAGTPVPDHAGGDDGDGGDGAGPKKRVRVRFADEDGDEEG
jgi:hypothetical protein